jgi:Ca-activated chloride channel family protein
VQPLRYLFALLVAAMLSPAFTHAAVTMTAPPTAPAGAIVTIAWSGDVDPRDFVTIVAADAPEGKYDAYAYANASPVELWVPDDPGKYEVRLLAKDGPYATRARQALEVTAVSATITGPTSVTAGAKVAFEWTGPNQKQDFLTIVDAGAPERTYQAYVYAAKGSPAELLAPEQPGSYEVRYLTGQKYYTLGRHAFSVGGLAVTLEAPASVVEGAKIEVRVSGNGNPSDFLTIVRPDAAEKTYHAYAYAGDGATVRLTAPEEPGAWEIR